MRVNFMSFTLGQDSKQAFYTPLHRVRTAPERRCRPTALDLGDD